jgi:phytoene dehydrogenase-like protein
MGRVVAVTTRRELLAATTLGWLASQIAPAPRSLEGRIVGASHRIGHLLRDGLPSGDPASISRADVIVVGSGISGLSAAWRMAPHGLDVRMLELEPFVGGTSAWGDDGPVPHPWGAHYIAAPNPEARAALKLLAEMDILTHYDSAGRAVYDPKVLCHAPSERLFYDGAWCSGLVPEGALDRETEEELARFTEACTAFSERTGRDGRRLFQIPLFLSSLDAETLAFDRMSMSVYLDEAGYRTPFFRWYVRYAMLDDFGAEPGEVSAWAGLHYFAARRAESAELEGSRFLVWPEGNGRLAKALAERSGVTVSNGALALSVTESKAGVSVLYLDVETGVLKRIDGRAVVLAVPGFVASRLVPGAAGRIPSRTSSPWLVANLHVTRELEPDHPWDSVLYGADGLGYVDASHQLFVPTERTVLTYYRAFGGPEVGAARSSLASASWWALAKGVFADLAPAHPDLMARTERLDVMLWGHAMPRPCPGFLGPTPFEARRTLGPRIAWGHVDIPGMALFEEAQHAGVLAAEVALSSMGLDPGLTWT